MSPYLAFLCLSSPALPEHPLPWWWWPLLDGIA